MLLPCFSSTGSWDSFLHCSCCVCELPGVSWREPTSTSFQQLYSTMKSIPVLTLRSSYAGRTIKESWLVLLHRLYLAVFHCPQTGRKSLKTSENKMKQDAQVEWNRLRVGLAQYRINLSAVQSLGAAVNMFIMVSLSCLKAQSVELLLWSFKIIYLNLYFQ